MGLPVGLRAPEVLDATHILAGFNSGTPSLDDWLQRRALPNQLSGASRSYVLCDGQRVIGYYALASGGVATATAPGRFRRNMPDPIPVVVFARMAIDQLYQRQGLGRALFRDAALRVLAAADTIGIRGILMHAISAEATAFYMKLGFDPSPIDAMTLMITLADLRATQSP